jgi:hypothetical protein
MIKARDELKVFFFFNLEKVISREARDASGALISDVESGRKIQKKNCRKFVPCVLYSWEL